MVKSKEEVAKLLIALGDSRDKIATKLLNLGIRGHRRSCYTCPITRYIRDGERVRVSTSGNEASGRLFVSIYILGEINEAQYEFSLTEKFPQVRAVLDFMRFFDDGGYEELVTSE
jgi:hypothetical protein